MDKWSTAYEEAHAALKHARTALEHLAEVTDSPAGLGDRVRCAAVLAMPYTAFARYSTKPAKSRRSPGHGSPSTWIAS